MNAKHSGQFSFDIDLLSFPYQSSFLFSLFRYHTQRFLLSSLSHYNTQGLSCSVFLIGVALKMHTSSDEGKTSQGLGSRVLLDKVDKLRELGISHLVSLPQVRYEETMSQMKLKFD